MSRALFVVPSGSSACMAQQAGICCQRLPDRLAWDVAGCVYRLELAPGEAGGGIELRSTPTGRSPRACAWTPTIIPTRNASRFCRHPCRRRSAMPRTPGAQFLFAGRGIFVHGTGQTPAPKISAPIARRRHRGDIGNAKPSRHWRLARKFHSDHHWRKLTDSRPAPCQALRPVTLCTAAVGDVALYVGNGSVAHRRRLEVRPFGCSSSKPPGVIRQRPLPPNSVLLDEIRERRLTSASVTGPEKCQRRVWVGCRLSLRPDECQLQRSKPTFTVPMPAPLSALPRRS